MPSFSGSTSARTAVSGVRSSWETLDTYSRLVRSRRSIWVTSLNRPTAPAVAPISSTMGVMVMRRVISRWLKVRVTASPLLITASKSSHTALSGTYFMRASGRPTETFFCSNMPSMAGLMWVIWPSASMAMMPSDRPLSMCFRRLRSTMSMYMLRLSW